MKAAQRPLVYACSGCSNVAQLANDAALALDQQGLAEMSCIAGVGGNVPALVRVAQSGRAIIAIDGCPLHCVQACLAERGVQASHPVLLYELGYKKRKGQLAPPEDLEQVLRILTPLAVSLQAPA
ncbi:putative zinc-binding protein [Balneatrix alpica]|uniref:putative zinc-binding protein n=1 Tax=Balneatrix alpica TaxID=75684 RepID=UPI002739BB9C|nr:putative zinc-binding protein [Balneatrix alpica]